jgi:hypothetical protein
MADLASRTATYGCFVLKFDMEAFSFTGVSLARLSLRSTYLLLWSKCILRGRSPITVIKRECIKKQKEYISPDLLTFYKDPY